MVESAENCLKFFRFFCLFVRLVTQNGSIRLNHQLISAQWEELSGSRLVKKFSIQARIYEVTHDRFLRRK